MARRRDRRPAEEVTPSARVLAEYALRLEADWSRADLDALTDDDLADELRRLLAEDWATPGARAALRALEQTYEPTRGCA